MTKEALKFIVRFTVFFCVVFLATSFCKWSLFPLDWMSIRFSGVAALLMFIYSYQLDEEK